MSKTAKIIVIVAVIAVACVMAWLLFVRPAYVNVQAPPAETADRATKDTAHAAGLAHVHDHEEEAPTLRAGVTLPTQGGVITYFTGSYAPDSKAEDIVTGRAVHLRELFGSGYASARMVFSSDGTFTDSLLPTGARKGMYHIENGVLTAACFPDATLEIDVTAWSADGSKPTAFCVIYQTVGDKGYRVFYSEKE